MAKLPLPPNPLATPPEIHSLRVRTRVWRIYKTGGPYPTAWNQFREYGPLLSARFDHHDPPPRRQAKAILYAACDIVTCLAEFFQETRVIDRALDAPWLVGFEIERKLPLLDPTGGWPTRAGASMAISTGRRDRARAWSAAIHAAYPAIVGLCYGSSMYANRPAVAFYERAAAGLALAPKFHRALADGALLGRLGAAATELGYDLV